MIELIYMISGIVNDILLDIGIIIFIIRSRKFIKIKSLQIGRMLSEDLEMHKNGKIDINGKTAHYIIKNKNTFIKFDNDIYMIDSNKFELLLLNDINSIVKYWARVKD